MNSAFVNGRDYFRQRGFSDPGGPQKMSEPVSSRSILRAKRFARAD